MNKLLPGLVALVLLAAAPASAASISSMYVFGDSLSDQGNAFLLTGNLFPPPPYVQRATNGPVAVEHLANQLGVTLTPAVAGGTNYAVVGATTGPVEIPGSAPPAYSDNVAATSFGIPALAGTGMFNQVASFLSTAPVIDPASSLFVVWGGANDLSLNPSAETATQAVGNIGAMIGSLYAAGARQFLVPNLPSLALTPNGLAQDPLVQFQLAQLTVGFNTGLGATLDLLDGLPDIDIMRFDTFGLLATLAANPTAFGFDNITDPCVTGAFPFSVCSTPDTFLFWDSVHPSARAHALLGDALADAVVPEPALLTLLGVGIAASVGLRRRPGRRAP